MKRIVSIQDISCLGKCALTVALPVVSAMGVETAVIPTAMLSMHTDFPDFTFYDLTPAVPEVIAHWQRERISFDGIYIGYLGSLEQLALSAGFVDAFKNQENFFFLDPVMGDAGALYPGLPESFPREMRALCQKADIIVPNLTEACLLLERPFPGEEAGREKAREILKELSALGCKKVVLTGVIAAPGKVGAMAYERESERFFEYYNEQYPLRFHGTGDCFSSACVGALTRGLPLSAALPLAVDFTLESIRKSIADPQRRWYGVNFEEAIPMLIERLRRDLNAI